jgi:hypothetical protein
MSRFATAIVIQISYGHIIETDDDPYLKIVNDVCRYVLPAIVPPEGSAVDLFPSRTFHASFSVQSPQL